MPSDFEQFVLELPKRKKYSQQEINTLALKWAGERGLPPEIVKAVINAESSYNPYAVSGVGAKGIMQLMPGTAKGLGFDPTTGNIFDPDTNIKLGTKYLKELYQQFGGDWDKTLAAYNWGPHRVRKGGRMPLETKEYIAKVKKLAGIKDETKIDFSDFADFVKNLPKKKPVEFPPSLGKMTTAPALTTGVAQPEVPSPTYTPAEYVPARIYSVLAERPLYAMSEAVYRGFGKLAEVMKVPGGVTNWLKERAKEMKQPPITQKVEKTWQQFRKKYYEKGTGMGIIADITHGLDELGALLVHIKTLGLATPKVLPLKLPLTKGIVKPALKHAGKLGVYRALTTPGGLKERLTGGTMLIGYNLTPYVVTSMGITGLPAFAVDTMLNTFLTSPVYVRAIKESKDVNEFLSVAIPQFVMDVGMAWNTRKWPSLRQKQAIESYIPNRAKEMGISVKEYRQLMREWEPIFKQIEKQQAKVEPKVAHPIFKPTGVAKKIVKPTARKVPESLASHFRNRLSTMKIKAEGYKPKEDFWQFGIARTLSKKGTALDLAEAYEEALETGLIAPVPVGEHPSGYFLRLLQGQEKTVAKELDMTDAEIIKLSAERRNHYAKLTPEEKRVFTNGGKSRQADAEVEAYEDFAKLVDRLAAEEKIEAKAVHKIMPEYRKIVASKSTEELQRDLNKLSGLLKTKYDYEPPKDFTANWNAILYELDKRGIKIQGKSLVQRVKEGKKEYEEVKKRLLKLTPEEIAKAKAKTAVTPAEKKALRGPKPSEMKKYLEYGSTENRSAPFNTEFSANPFAVTKEGKLYMLGARGVGGKTIAKRIDKKWYSASSRYRKELPWKPDDLRKADEAYEEIISRTAKPKAEIGVSVVQEILKLRKQGIPLVEAYRQVWARPEFREKIASERIKAMERLIPMKKYPLPLEEVSILEIVGMPSKLRSVYERGVLELKKQGIVEKDARIIVAQKSRFRDYTLIYAKEIKPEAKPIPKELEGLAEEARKYKSAEEWKIAISKEPRGKTLLGEAVLGPLSMKGKFVQDYGFKNLYSFWQTAQRGKVAEGDKGIQARPYPVEDLSAKKWGVEMPKEPVTREVINKTEIVRKVERMFKVPIKGKATFRSKMAGRYHTKEEIVRLRKWGELEPMMHELGHHLDKKIKQALGKYWRSQGVPMGQRKALIKELADLDYSPKKRRTAEGFAEFMRYYLTTNEAPQKAPKFYRFFTGEFLTKNPDVEKNLSTLRKMLDVWQKQGAENRITQQIDWKGEHTRLDFKDKAFQAKNWLHKNWDDEFYILHYVEKELGIKPGTKYKPTQIPSVYAEYAKSKAGGIAKTFVTRAAVDFWGKPVGSSLEEVLRPIPKKEMKSFVAYAVSKRALDLHRRGIESGFDTDDAKFIIDEYKNRGWDLTVDNLTKWSNHLLDWIVEAGGLGPKEATLVRQLNPVYLPFKRAFIDRITVVRGVGKFADRGQAVKRIKGSGRPIINPVESLIAQATEFIAKAQKIHLAKLVADLAQKEGAGGFITKVPAPLEAKEFTVEKLKDALEKVGIDIGDAKLDDILTVFTQGWQYRGKDNIVSIFRGGKREFYEVHPEVYKALLGLDTLKRGALLKVLSPFARAVRLGATGLRFTFGYARNPFRDAFTYAVASKRSKATIFDPLLGYYKDVTARKGSPLWRYKAMGGEIATRMGFDRAAVMNVYDEMLLQRLGKKGMVLKVVKHPIDSMRQLFGIPEMGPRSMEMEGRYKDYLKKHPNWSEEDAFLMAFNDAQDVTINFTKSGYYAKRINEGAAFFNVAIRGPEKVYRLFKESPVATLIKALAWISLPAIALWYKNKDRWWYKNLPLSYKYGNYWFQTEDRTIVRLPIPFDLGIMFSSAPVALLDTAYRKKPEYMKGLLKMVKIQVPDPIPNVIKPIFDVARNKNYIGIPIESEGMQYRHFTKRERYYTSLVAKSLSQALYKSGLAKFGLKFSPVQIDYMLNSYTGGGLRQVSPLMGQSILDKADIPVLGELLLRMPERPQQQLNEFYSVYETLSQKYQAGIITREENERLKRMKPTYNWLNQTAFKWLKIFQEKKDTKKIQALYKLMTQKLETYGKWETHKATIDRKRAQ